MKRPRAVPWLAAPATFALALVVLVAIGVALQKAFHGRDNWQVNAPSIAGLTAILLLAPSSSTQPKARNALVAAVGGLAVVAGGFGVTVAGHEPDTTYSAMAFVIVAVGAIAGCLVFTALTHVEGWTMAARTGSTAAAVGKPHGAAGDNATDANATTANDADTTTANDAPSTAPDEMPTAEARE
jgi:hypothetical protein